VLAFVVAFGGLTASASASPLVSSHAAAHFAASTAPSKNWGGFIAGGPGVHFRTVSARWRQPAARCGASKVSLAATWIGLGGVTSKPLEQTGTWVACIHGHPELLAWFELLPAPPRFLQMRVRAGDLISARVTVVGHQVSFVLDNASEGESFRHTFTAPHINVATADWVQEAPAACTHANSCHIVRLADFGTVHFAAAHAVSVRGHSGSISSRSWRRIRVILVQQGSNFTHLAVPSRLTAGGSAFAVAYRAHL
jgi:hypothetical protein